MSYTFPSTGNKHSMQQMLADIEDEEQEEDQDSTTLEGQPTDAIVSKKDNPADGDEDVVNLTEFYTIAGLLLSLFRMWHGKTLIRQSAQQEGSEHNR